MKQPLAIDLFCGLGGWAEGLMAEGFDVIGFDIERHEYGEHRYPAQLVIQDVRTLHGRQFKSADLIVASPPCQEFSYMAMPWTRAKQIAAALRGEAEFPDNYKGSRTIDELNELFDACFRIQREASEAAGRHIPMVVENVRGAQPWVGRARWNHGSYYLWGDVPALMPIVPPRAAFKGGDVGWRGDGPGRQLQDHAYKVLSADGNYRTAKGKGARFTEPTYAEIKNAGGSWFGVAHNTTSGKGRNPDGRNAEHAPRMDGTKLGGTWFHDYANGRGMRSHNSRSTKCKMVSALIAKIPFELARHVASIYGQRVDFPSLNQ